MFKSRSLFYCILFLFLTFSPRIAQAQDSLRLELNNYWYTFSAEYADNEPEIVRVDPPYLFSIDDNNTGYYSIYRYDELPATPGAPNWVGTINFGLDDATAPADANFRGAFFLSSDLILAGYFSQTGIGVNNRQTFGRLWRRTVDPQDTENEAYYVQSDDYVSYDYDYTRAVARLTSGAVTAFAYTEQGDLRFTRLGTVSDDNFLSRLKESNAAAIESGDPVNSIAFSQLEGRNITFLENSRFILAQGNSVVLVNYSDLELPVIENQRTIEGNTYWVKSDDLYTYMYDPGDDKLYVMGSIDFQLYDVIDLPEWVSEEDAWAVTDDEMSFISFGQSDNTHAAIYRKQFVSELGRDQLTLTAIGTNLIPSSFGFPQGKFRIFGTRGVFLTMTENGNDFSTIYANYTLIPTDRMGTNNEEDPDRSDTFQLDQNYPNPFNPTTNISFTLPSAQSVSLEVFNMLGQRVSVLAQGRHPAGSHTVTFDASGLSSGIYIYRLNGTGLTEIRKMLLVK